LHAYRLATAARPRKIQQLPLGPAPLAIGDRSRRVPSEISCCAYTCSRVAMAISMRVSLVRGKQRLSGPDERNPFRAHVRRLVFDLDRTRRA
jgi:hypothetical protein